MKAILINPSMDFSKFGAYARFMEPMPPLGLAYIASALEKAGARVNVIDNFVFRSNVDSILNEIKRHQPDFVGISCLTPSATNVFAIARAIRAYNKNIVITLGNIHATVFANSILKKEEVDIIVRGEGEFIVYELASALIENKPLEGILGISFKRDGDIIHTPDRPINMNLDELPYPAWHLFPYKDYGFLPFMDVKKPGLSILSSRGCPYRCVFCSLLEMSSIYRKRKPSAVVDEFEYLINNFPIKQIGFVDPAFALSRPDAIEICNQLINRHLNKLTWICETRVDLMDKELLSLMKEAGCRRILYGIETGTEESLKTAQKNFGLKDVQETISCTKNIGIETSGLFMIGFPGETKEMILDTIQFSKILDLDFAKFAITVPYPGSQLYNNLIKSGTFDRTDWENYVTFNTEPEKLICIPGSLPARDLINMQRRAHFEFYFRIKIILRQLFKLRTIKLINLFFGLYAIFFYKIKPRKTRS